MNEFLSKLISLSSGLCWQQLDQSEHSPVRETPLSPDAVPSHVSLVSELTLTQLNCFVALLFLNNLIVSSLTVSPYVWAIFHSLLHVAQYYQVAHGVNGPAGQSALRRVSVTWMMWESDADFAAAAKHSRLSTTHTHDLCVMETMRSMSPATLSTVQVQNPSSFMHINRIYCMHQSNNCTLLSLKR